MGKSHLFKRQLDSRNSRRYAKLGDNPPNPLCQLQKARLELVELGVNRAKQAPGEQNKEKH